MADGGEKINSFQSMILDLPPSCVEICPRYPSHFLVGTYYLETSEAEAKDTEKDNDGADVEVEARQAQSKSGSIIVFELKDGQAHVSQHIKQTVPQPSAVFDLHFAPQADRGDICAAVSSTGTISFFRLIPDPPTSTERTEDGQYLQALSVLRIPRLPEDDSFTYFIWHPETPGLMAITTSTGKVILARVQSDYKKIKRLGTILKHEAEAWCVAFSPLSRRALSSEVTLSTVFSGGDDFKLLLRTHITSTDTQEVKPSDPEPAASSGSDFESEQDSAPPRDSQVIRHDAGVTAILPLPLRTSDGCDIVVTGSYSDHISVWGVFPPYKYHGVSVLRKLLKRRDLGGGVWRLKAIEELSDYPAHSWTVTLLVSCMHAGARVVRLEGNPAAVNSIEVLWRFEEHESMNYGSDYTWVDRREFFGEGEGRKIVCVSTSFYDKKLCLWTF
ncbi:hypothetical protein INS49_013730 [Diaporthe citri]|uniref:uncharacterized protein n=1 Tax=Diaporthe citri TaxID=83186 RepID=UPI001C814A7E|nr:uncharacterized protein INS49_013730 [Diaporthe citri]KAG6357849.1 hypothetical protein INS49_013730 [Diaporthe citri]